jgi:uncharacterized protein (TIGR00369 family)
MTEERPEGLIELLGLEEESLGPGRVAFRLLTDARHANIQGVVHGVVAIALLDSAMGHALDSTLEPGEFCSTTQFSTQFLRAVRPGERIEAIGEVTRRGRRIAYLEGACRNAEGELVARAHGTWYVGKAHS